MNVTARGRAGILLLAATLGGACSSDSGVDPGPQPPTIAIHGVTEGAIYTTPVTISIAVNRGSYEATLNGERISSGRTISAPASYTLVVIARDGLQTATQQVSFTIAPPAGGVLIVRVLDLGANASGGGGDAILMTDSSTAGRVHALIDAGPAGTGGADVDFVRRRLAALGVDTLAYMILTHAHSDHYAGMSSVLAALKVRRFVYNGQVRSAVTYERTISDARARADSIIVVRDSIPVAFGRSDVQSRFTILPPLPTWLSIDTDSSTVLNDGSVGVQLRRGSFEMFFTGDSEVQANNRWRLQFGAYTRSIDVLKVGHHGANNAIFDNGFNGSSTWLDHTTPSIAVISANGTSHPRTNALAQLLSRTSKRTYCTNVHGDITLRVFSDSKVQVDVQKNAGSDCVPGSQATT